MSSLPSRFSFLIAAAFLFITITLSADGAEPSNPPNGLAPTTLEIVDGRISNLTRNGKPVPATLRNIVSLVLSDNQYWNASITMVGVEDLLIDNITLQLARRPESLDIALAALGEASGRKFRAQRFGTSDILLVSDPQGGPARGVEVFNLSLLLGNRDSKMLGRKLRDAETEFNVYRKNFGAEHQDVLIRKTQMELLAARRDAADHSEPDDRKLIDQIKVTVQVTLDRLKSSEKAPDFQFHPGTNLLVVVGGADAIEVTRKVVAALEKSPQ